MKKIENPELIIPHRTAAIDAIEQRYAVYPAGEERSADEYFMDCALELARVAADGGEVPVGCVIVRDGKLISAGANGREVFRDATHHAECAAISSAGRLLGGWRLIGCTLYVTLEPCPMCAGAIWCARVPRVVIGARDPNSGAMGSVIDMTSLGLNHTPEVTFGVRGGECSAILRDFFKKRR